MSRRIERLLENLTPQEQAELEAFAAFLIARRTLGHYQVLTDDISAEELLELIMQSGSFDWLADSREDGYSLADGDEVTWPPSV
jgi:alkylhydroperoxidase family enzyme